MRLEWVKRRLQAWAAWQEETLEGRVSSPKIDGMPHAGAIETAVPDEHRFERETLMALRALHRLYPDYSETIALVYVVGPRANKVRLSEIAAWVGLTETALAMRIERAERKFSEMLEKARDVADLAL